MRTSLLSAAAFAVTSVSAHGNITFPPARLPGPAMLAACGQSAVNTVLGDGTIALEEVQPASANCNIGLCRGAQFADNRNRVQTFSPGQVVVIEVDLTIPHEGPANVSIVETKTNTIVGDILLFFESYADEKLAELPANNSAFGVTIPDGKAGQEVAARCGSPGDCVLQWWWLGTGAKQTYESCIDFVLGKPGPGGPNAGAALEGVPGGAALAGAGIGFGAGTTGLNTPPAPGMADMPGMNMPGAASAKGGAYGSDGASSVSSTSGVSSDAAPADSFGGVQGSVPISDAGSAVDAGAGAGAGATTDATLGGEFGGVSGTASVRRSRVFRG